MSHCACGHPESEHVTTAMSVPLLYRPPIYPLPGQPLNNGIHRPYPNASYDQQLCHCGCSMWTPDEEADGFTKTL